MSRSVALGLVLAIGALVFLVLWLAPSGRRGVELIQHEGVPAELAKPRGRLTSPPAADEVAKVGESDAPVELERDAAASVVQRSESRDERPRISGTVLVPGGIPSAEIVKVRAEATASEDGGPARTFEVLVAGDGSFALVVPAKARRVKLGLESRFLALRQPVMAGPGETDVVLEPDVYAAIEGVVVPPGSPPKEVASGEMRVSWVLYPDRTFAREDEARARRSPSHERPVRPDGAGAFVLGHVPAGLLLELQAKNPFGPEWNQILRPLEAFEIRRVEIALEPGITISGRVIDEHDRPVEDVWVSIDERFADPWKPRSRTPSRTDAEGRFVLMAAAGQFTHIAAERNDLVSGGRTFVDGRDGDVHDLLLSVVRGGCIEGTVVWPDRSPVERFEVTASSPQGSRQASGTWGRFRLCGLEVAQRVEIRAMRGDVRGTARALAVEPGAAPLDLVLEEAGAFRLAGTVVDEQGSPIGEFTVRGVGRAYVRRYAGVTSSDGTFVLSGLEAGSWTLEVAARGYQPSSLQVDVGEGTPHQRIVLRRGARIRGTVVDPSGAPVWGAWVGEESHAFEVDFAGTREGSTDAEGHFEIQASSSKPRILAHKSGFAASEVKSLELGPGQIAEGVVLVLRETCRVEGRVLDERGDPLPDARVSVSWSAFAPLTAETDARGAFVLHGLPPGAADLVASHRRKVDAHASATVALVPGQVNAVELRFEVPDLVRAHGRITRAGRPVECKLWLRSRSFTAEGASGADGRFELSLQRAGEWSGAIWTATEDPWREELDKSDVRRFDVSIPDSDEHSFDLELEALPRITSEQELPR